MTNKTTLYNLPVMELEQAAKCLAELGNPSRLATVRLLVRAGIDGLPVKAIQEHLGVPASTLSHHLFHLVSAGLVNQTREGRVLRCRVNFSVVKQVLDFLLEDCCAGIRDLRPSGM